MPKSALFPDSHQKFRQLCRAGKVGPALELSSSLTARPAPGRHNSRLT
jgi:hypothetical protein